MAPNLKCACHQSGWCSRIWNGLKTPNTFVRKQEENFWFWGECWHYLTVFQLFDAYTKEICSIFEMVVTVWHSGLTKIQILDIKSIQTVAMRIILQQNYVTYELACKQFSTDTLQQRRTKLCNKFAVKNLKSENYFFTKVGTNVTTT